MNKLTGCVVFRFLSLLTPLLMMTASPAQAGPEWPDAETHCDGGSCWTTASEGAALKAYADLKKNSQDDGSTEDKIARYAKISAALAAGGGLVYGTGKLMAYRAGIKEAAQAAALLEKEIVKVGLSVTKALEPELSRFGLALFKANEKRAAEGLAQLSRDQIQEALAKGLASQNVKARILSRLTKTLGPAAESAFEKVLGPKSLSSMAMEFDAMTQLAARGAGKIAMSKMGAALAGGAARLVAPSTARLTLRAALVAAGESGFARGCLGKLGVVGKGALKIFASTTFSVLLMMLDSSTADAATLSGFYYHNPQALVALKPEEALYYLNQYRELRAPLMAARDVMTEMDAQAGQADPNGDSTSVLMCTLDRPAPAPNYSELPAQVCLREDAAADGAAEGELELTSQGTLAGGGK